jgi:hypothetical protein
MSMTIDFAYHHAVLATKDAEIARLEDENEQALKYATSFLVSFVNEHCDPIGGWKPLPDLMGVLTQLDNATTVVRDIKAENERMREALEKLHHAVCGPTGFAEAIRTTTNTAYPWPALDEADDLARAALSPIPDPAGGMPVEVKP